MDITKTIAQIKTNFLAELEQVKSSDDCEKIRITFLGRKGEIAVLIDIFKTLPLDERKKYGPSIQQLRTTLEEALAKKDKTFSEKKEIEQFFDVTTSLYAELKGTKHIFSQVTEELEDIFLSMGYDIIEGNEVEDAYYNFTALNIPEHHPAREITDTFWLEQKELLLRTHTSSVQAHIMKQKTPPMAIFSSGRCYRNEKTDATHDFMFMQAECIFIDQHVSIGNLLATAQMFLRIFFKKDNLSIRVRPGYFPFVQPGLEIDATCPFCTGGCTICKKTGWVEMLGSGLIHPHVLRMSGIDETKYTGFAFGCGIERLIMLRHNITDIRLLRSNKIAFLDQF